jgi:hypothetical protein
LKTLLKDAWWITKRDLKSEKLLIVITLLFMAYQALMISLLIDEQLQIQSKSPVIVDILLLAYIPLLGFFFSKRSIKCLTEDSYTQLLVYLRTLPISPKSIMTSRLLQLIIALMMNSAIFFSVMYGISPQLRTEMSFGIYMGFALTWIGYALAISGLYIYFEFLFSGKQYFGLTMLLVVITCVIGIMIRIMGGNMLLYTIRMSQEWGILSPMMWGALIGGLMSLALLGKLTNRKLQSRDLV